MAKSRWLFSKKSSILVPLVSAYAYNYDWIMIVHFYFIFFCYTFVFSRNAKPKLSMDFDRQNVQISDCTFFIFKFYK